MKGPNCVSIFFLSAKKFQRSKLNPFKLYFNKIKELKQRICKRNQPVVGANISGQPDCLAHVNKIATYYITPNKAVAWGCSS